jgi:adenylyltransferase/sulfurtransferase
VITGVGESLVGRVTTYDARSGRFRELTYGRDPEASPVTELIDYEQFCGTAPEASTVADRSGQAPTANSGAADVIDDLAPAELAALLAASTEADTPLLLLDVREPWEHELVALPGSTLVPLGQLPGAIAGLPRDRAIIAYCHHGIRSRHALNQLQAAGLNARHLTGGIDAWSTQVDPGLVRY